MSDEITTKKESALTAKSEVNSTDFLRLIGSNGVSYKNLVTDVARYIMENYAGTTLAGSAQTPKAAIDALKATNDSQDASIDSLNGKTSLSTSYISNPHVSSTSFGRVYAYKRGNTLFLNGNIEATWNGGFSTFVPIGTITGWNAVSDVFGLACSQTDPAYGVTFKVSTSGEISLYATKQWAGTPFMRFFACVPCS